MKAADFEDFLKYCGNAYTMEKTDFGTAFIFRDRGDEFISLAYKDDPDLLHLTSRRSVPSSASLRKVLAKLLPELELKYPVVKLRAVESAGAAGFEVSSEQFEADPERTAQIFWRTIDLMRSVANDCFSRLQPVPPRQADAGQDERGKWIEHIEAALRDGCPPAGCETESISARLRASIALVMLPDESTGSAFCVHSTDNSSFYVTNAHVVQDATEVIVYRQSPEYEKMAGSVVATGNVNEVDLAIVSVATPNIRPVTIHGAPVQTDTAVGVAGYARVQIWAADMLGELIPSIHFGTVTAVNKTGSKIMHDALSRPGNSGGPLFDSLTGDVVGVEEEGWEEEEEAIAIGIPILAQFLTQHSISFTSSAAETPMAKSHVDTPIAHRRSTHR